MQKESTIEHTGIVKSAGEDYAIVDIVAHPACSGCLASGICDLSAQKNKEIRTINNTDVKAGDRVLVVMRQSLGFRALFLGYLLPFIVVMIILIIMTSLSFSEPISGITALLSLIPYYIIIYLKKEKIGKSFSFTIKKQIT
ncbi:MAG TPA: RseC/MucC family positive regulator of sigma(E) [Bacteroidetes bacterium]|nr:RseC/MucC family positive regulator of sigma(E) [Bacteroidota bacterium]